MSEVGVLFGDIHTYTKWGLRLKKIVIGQPSAKSILIDIEGGDGVLDLSTALTGDVHYNTRKLEFTFDAPNCDYHRWTELISEIMDDLHGQRKRIILDIDPSYYYDGIINVSNDKINKIFTDVVIAAECQPYKMERYSSLEDWEWDPFNFETGIIREYREIRVDGSLEFIIEGRRKNVVPAFTVTSDDGSGLQIRFNGTTYNLSDGTSRVLNIVLKSGVNTLYFTGNGTVSIDYRGGRL